MSRVGGAGDQHPPNDLGEDASVYKGSGGADGRGEEKEKGEGRKRDRWRCVFELRSGRRTGEKRGEGRKKDRQD